MKFQDGIQIDHNLRDQYSIVFSLVFMFDLHCLSLQGYGFRFQHVSAPQAQEAIALLRGTVSSGPKNPLVTRSFKS